MKCRIALLLVLVCALLLGSTQLVSGGGPCDGVQNTPMFTHFYGYANFLEVGDVVEAISPRGDRCGCFVVHTAGLWGYMRVYGEDTFGTPGMRYGEPVTIKVNGVKMATAPSSVIWQSDWNPYEVDLLGQFYHLYLPIVVNN